MICDILELQGIGFGCFLLGFMHNGHRRGEYGKHRGLLNLALTRFKNHSFTLKGVT